MLSDTHPTGYHGTELAQVGIDDSVVIYGAGPVGLMAAMSARRRPGLRDRPTARPAQARRGRRPPGARPRQRREARYDDQRPRQGRQTGQMRVVEVRPPRTRTPRASSPRRNGSPSTSAPPSSRARRRVPVRPTSKQYHRQLRNLIHRDKLNPGIIVELTPDQPPGATSGSTTRVGLDQGPAAHLSSPTQPGTVPVNESTTRRMTMSKSRNVAAQKAIGEAVNSGNLDAFDAVVALDAVDHDPAPGQAPGPNGDKSFLASCARRSPTFRSRSSTSWPTTRA